MIRWCPPSMSNRHSVCKYRKRLLYFAWKRKHRRAESGPTWYNIRPSVTIMLHFLIYCCAFLLLLLVHSSSLFFCFQSPMPLFRTYELEKSAFFAAQNGGTYRYTIREPSTTAIQKKKKSQGISALGNSRWECVRIRPQFRLACKLEIVNYASKCIACD